MLEGLSSTKINNFNLVEHLVSLEQNVLRLQVAMDNAMTVAVANARKQLLKESSSVLLVKLTLVDDFVEKFTTLNVFRHNVEALLVLKVLKNFNNVGMIEGS